MVITKIDLHSVALTEYGTEPRMTCEAEMEKIRDAPVNKPETLGHFLNRFVLTRQAVMEQIEVNEQAWFKRIEAKFRVFTNEHDVVFDSDSTSELGLLKHLEDNVCVAHEIDNGEYTLLELYLEKEKTHGN